MSLQATVIPAADDAYNQRPSVHSCVPVAHTFTQVSVVEVLVVVVVIFVVVCNLLVSHDCGSGPSRTSYSSLSLFSLLYLKALSSKSVYLRPLSTS
eukprot:gene3588-37_t